MGQGGFVFWTLLQRLGQKADGFVIAAALAFQISQHLQRGEIAGVGAQDLAVQPVGLRGIAAAMRRQRLLE